MKTLSVADLPDPKSRALLSAAYEYAFPSGAHGMMLCGNTFQTTQPALSRISYTLKEAPSIDPQLLLDLQAAIARTKNNTGA